MSTSLDNDTLMSDTYDIKDRPRDISWDKYNGVFYFETDHVALKGYRDYNEMCKSIALLEAQKIKALKDLDVLHEKYKESLQDPIGFVKKLQCKVDLELPGPQKIATLPYIDWKKYTSSEAFQSLAVNKRMTRWKSQIENSTTETDKTDDYSTMENVDLTIVRGRVKQEGKSDSFNKLWTVEEQQKLEQLLVEFPNEGVEARRFKKIADALGTRTPQQVASRIQKYFIKLAKANLPIPGRVPSINIYPKKVHHRHQRYHRFYYTPSTFLVSHEPPVYMSDDEDSDTPTAQPSSACSSISGVTPDVSDDEEIPASLRQTQEYAELIALKNLKKQKLRLSRTKHYGFKCDSCNMDPIVGVRWHCLDCPPEHSLDICDTCADSCFETATHDSSHRLDDVTIPVTCDTVDTDYTQFQPDGYNYLDPNFMPAT